MKKLYAIALVAIAMLAGLLTLQAPANAVTGTAAIYFTPHQDDETLSMGPDIRASLEADRQVIVVLLTDGSESGYCYTGYGTGETRAGGGLTPAHRANCTADRDREIQNALTKVQSSVGKGSVQLVKATVGGIRMQDSCSNPTIASQMVASPCTPANTLTVANALAIMQPYATQYGGASFKTLTYHESDYCGGCTLTTADDTAENGGHPDHANAGAALVQVTGVAKNANGVEDKRYFVKSVLWSHNSAWSATTHVNRNVDGMLNMYGDFGWHSVACDFTEQESAIGSLTPNGEGKRPENYCTGYTQKVAGGADSYYHIPGK